MSPLNGRGDYFTFQHFARLRKFARRPGGAGGGGKGRRGGAEKILLIPIPIKFEVIFTCVMLGSAEGSEQVMIDNARGGDQTVCRHGHGGFVAAA